MSFEELARFELGYRISCIDEYDTEYETKVWAILTYVRIKYKVVIYAWELGLHEFPPMYKFAKEFNRIEPLDLSDMLKGE